jgi:hypothetical protein
MALIDTVRKRLRITHNALDDDILDLINAAKTELMIVGITKLEETDPLIIQAISTYCKAEFGLNNPEYEKFRAAFESLRNHLTLVGEYTETVGDIIT